MNNVKGGKALGKWIKHVTLDELNNAGLTAKQLSYASSHWLDKKIFSDIAREKNVTPGMVWITMRTCQAKIMKRRAEIIMGIKPGAGARRKKASTAPIKATEKVAKPAETEPAAPVQPPAIEKPPMSAKLPAAVTIKPNQRQKPVGDGSEEKEIEVAIIEDPEGGKIIVPISGLDEEEPSDQCLAEIEALESETTPDDPNEYVEHANYPKSAQNTQGGTGRRLMKGGNGKDLNPTSIYLSEMRGTSLLTKEEEIKLAKKIEKAKKALARAESVRTASARNDKIKSAGTKFNSLRNEIKSARAKIDSLRNEMAVANLRLVVSIAKKYTNHGLQFIDLIQEGNIGLMTAVNKFEYRRGYKFSTYATWWIRQTITRAISDQSRTIRIPVHMVETINRLIRTSRYLMQELGRKPSPEEIAERMECSVKKVYKILGIGKEPVSLSTPIGDEEDSFLDEFIVDQWAISPLKANIDVNLAERIRFILSTLKPREEIVMRLRFGIGENYEPSPIPGEILEKKARKNYRRATYH